MFRSKFNRWYLLLQWIAVSPIFFRINWTNKTIPYVKVHCGEDLDICIQWLRHFQACPLPPPPPPPSPSPEIFVGLFSLKSCSKSQTERTAGSNINLTMGRKILEMLLHEDKAKIVSMKDAKKIENTSIY